MKRILFVMNNLNVGGAEKALVSMLAEFDYSKYQVDLFLFSHEGLFLKQLPPNVNLLPEPEDFRYFNMPMKAAIIENLEKGNLAVAFNRFIAGYIFKTDKNRARREQRVWKYLSKAIPTLPGHYDAAIGYLEKMPIYFCVDKVNAAKKVGFIHNDYKMLGMKPALDRPYFKKLDHIFTVSESCESVLHGIFPEFKNKISIMYNIVSRGTIQNLASANVDLGQGVTLVSVGRLNHQKGFDMAIDACKILADLGYDIKWYILGEGTDRPMLESKIRQSGLENRFIFCGLQENPYPYVAKCDIYVQPSRFEGKSIAIDEAKILAKPIVVTDFPSVGDQIRHLENGFVVSIAAESIAGGIRELIERPELREKFTSALQSESNHTAAEIAKLYHEIEKPV